MPIASSPIAGLPIAGTPGGAASAGFAAGTGTATGVFGSLTSGIGAAAGIGAAYGIEYILAQAIGSAAGVGNATGRAMIFIPDFPPGSGAYQWATSFWNFPLSLMRSMTYDTNLQMMRVVMKSGLILLYSDVPQGLATEFLYSSNPDTFYDNQVVGAFPVVSS